MSIGRLGFTCYLTDEIEIKCKRKAELIRESSKAKGRFQIPHSHLHMGIRFPFIPVAEAKQLVALKKGIGIGSKGCGGSL